MDLFSGMNDDQSALVGCAIALVVCGGMLSLSSIFGRGKSGSDSQATLKFPADSARARNTDAAVATVEKKSTERRAA